MPPTTSSDLEYRDAGRARQIVQRALRTMTMPEIVVALGAAGDSTIRQWQAGGVTVVSERFARRLRRLERRLP